jgi:hypothetical protein
MMTIRRFGFTIDESGPPHMLKWAATNMHVNVVVAERKKINSNIFYPVQGQTTSFALSFDLEAFFHSNTKAKILDPFLALPSLTNKN